jgi:hypothetical protein
MVTRNNGVVNVVEKVKEYQKRKNLEIPPSFRGNSFAVLPPTILNDMADKVNISIGIDASDNAHIIQTLVDKVLGKNLKFAHANPVSVLPLSLDPVYAQLPGQAGPPSYASTRSGPGYQLIDDRCQVDSSSRGKENDIGKGLL